MPCPREPFKFKSAFKEGDILSILILMIGVIFIDSWLDTKHLWVYKLFRRIDIKYVKLPNTPVIG